MKIKYSPISDVGRKQRRCPSCELISSLLFILGQPGRSALVLRLAHGFQMSRTPAVFNLSTSLSVVLITSVDLV